MFRDRSRLWTVGGELGRGTEQELGEEEEEEEEEEERGEEEEERGWEKVR